MDSILKPRHIGWGVYGNSRQGLCDRRSAEPQKLGLETPRIAYLAKSNIPLTELLYAAFLPITASSISLAGIQLDKDSVRRTLGEQASE